MNFRSYRHTKDHNPKYSHMNTRRADLDKKNNFIGDLKKLEEEKKMVDNLTKKPGMNSEISMVDKLSSRTISRRAS